MSMEETLCLTNQMNIQRKKAICFLVDLFYISENGYWIIVFRTMWFFFKDLMIYWRIQRHIIKLVKIFGITAGNYIHFPIKNL